jgi:hypothetical protein
MSNYGVSVRIGDSVYTHEFVHHGDANDALEFVKNFVNISYAQEFNPLVLASATEPPTEGGGMVPDNVGAVPAFAHAADVPPPFYSPDPTPDQVNPEPVYNAETADAALGRVNKYIMSFGGLTAEVIEDSDAFTVHVPGNADELEYSSSFHTGDNNYASVQTTMLSRECIVISGGNHMRFRLQPYGVDSILVTPFDPSGNPMNALVSIHEVGRLTTDVISSIKKTTRDILSNLSVMCLSYGSETPLIVETDNEPAPETPVAAVAVSPELQDAPSHPSAAIDQAITAVAPALAAHAYDLKEDDLESAIAAADTAIKELFVEEDPWISDSLENIVAQVANADTDQTEEGSLS